MRHNLIVQEAVGMPLSILGNFSKKDANISNFLEWLVFSSWCLDENLSFSNFSFYDFCHFFRQKIWFFVKSLDKKPYYLSEKMTNNIFY